MELKDRFDLATTGGPEHSPVGEDLARGRSARRRRTAGLAALSTAAVLAASPVAMTLLDRDAPASPTVAANPDPTPTQEGYEWGPGELARMTMQGNVMVRAGATETERLTSTIEGRRSVALDLTWEGHRHYVLLYRTLSGFATAVHAEAPQSSLAVWVAEVAPEGELPVALHNGVGGGADLPLVGYSDHQLYTVDGAEIVRVIDDPVDGWCEHAAHSTAAVELLHEGTTYYAILGDGNCGGSFGSSSRSLDEAVAQFAPVPAS